MQDTVLTQPRRLLFYAHYDPHGELDPHVLYQIKSLADFGIETIFISNSPLDADARARLQPYVTKIIERPDEGYDWTAWKEALMGLGREKAGEYAELIIMNDSTYGPFFPLAEMFEVMAKTGVDFWGITRAQHDYFGEHLQPYFCVFRPGLFNSDVFWDFWKHLPEMRGFRDAVIYGELAMTRIFNEAGFIHGTYADLFLHSLMPETGASEPLTYSAAPWLISNYRAPFAKIKAFSTRPALPFQNGINFFDALEEGGSAYPKELIIEHLAKKKPLSWSKNTPGFLNVLPAAGDILPETDLKIAVYAHLFYEDQFNEALGCLSKIPHAFDLYISTSSEEKKENLFSLLSALPEFKAANTEIRVFEDRGRDVAPWLFGFKDVQYKYDLALKFHLKKSTHYNAIFSDWWQKFILKSTLASPVYISNIFDLFKKRPGLGIAFHTSPPPLLLFHHSYGGNDEERRNFEQALNACGIMTPVETSYPVFPQNIFWYRPKALKALFESALILEDFPPEPFPKYGTIAHGLERAIPYIVQAAGYQVGKIIPDNLLLETFQQYEDHIAHLFDTGWRKNEEDLEPSPWAVDAWDLAQGKAG